MPNLVSVLREEVRRLARKEVRAQTNTTRKASAQHRRDIADLKRQVQALTRRLSYLERQENKRAAKPAPAKTAQGARFSAKGVKSHRQRLGLSAADYGRLLDVSGLTVYNWEHGKSRPRQRQLASLVAVRALGKREAQQRIGMLDDSK